MRLRTVLTGLGILAAVCGGAGVAVYYSMPPPDRQPALAEVPPLPPVNRTSVIVTPVRIALTAIADFMEATAPSDLSGKRDFRIGSVISNGEIHWTVKRGRLSVSGRPETIAIATPLTGTVHATGQISGASGIAGALGALLGGNGARGGDKGSPRSLDQRADMRGNLVMTSRPVLTPAWRIEPNLSAQPSVTDANLNLSGMRVNLKPQVEPLLERTVGERMKELEARVRNDPLLEQVARREWAKLCRSRSIGAAHPGLPDLWLELRPRRVTAAQPRIDGESVTLTIGVEAEARILPQQTTPDCPFPATVEIVPPADAGRIAIALPVDMPFTEVNRLFELQLAGKTFADRDGRFHVAVRRATVAPSGNRLLISMRVRANEERSWFGLATEATVHVWGRPVLDRENQVLRLADVVLDVESEGALGAVAQTMAPFLASVVAQQATIDLKPYAANASRSIAAALSEFRAAGDGVSIDAAVKDIRLVDIAFDATTLRLIAEADGTAGVTITKLPAR
jgi:hypothetical protein